MKDMVNVLTAIENTRKELKEDLLRHEEKIDVIHIDINEIKIKVAQMEEHMKQTNGKVAEHEKKINDNTGNIQGLINLKNLTTGKIIGISIVTGAIGAGIVFAVPLALQIFGVI